MTSNIEDQKQYSEIYRNTVKEIYFICRYAGTSYEDVKKMTPTEKDYMIKFVQEELQEKEKKIKEIQESQKR